MNKEMQIYARESLKKGLIKCTEGEQLMFKRMYSHNNLELSIDKVIDNMPEDKLDWAMQQVQRTLDRKQLIKKT